MNAPETFPKAQLHPPRDAQADGKKTGRARHFFALARSYIAFYKQGLRQTWQNRRTCKLLHSKLLDSDPAAIHSLTRHQFQLLHRTKHDMRRLPWFVILLCITGEFTPILLPFMGSLIPRTCTLPQTTVALRKRNAALELRAGQLDRRVSRDSPLIGNFSSLHLDKSTLGLICRSRNVIGRFIPTSFYPSALLRHRLHLHEKYLRDDDRLIIKHGGPEKLDTTELNCCLDERGRFLSEEEFKSIERKQKELWHWLATTQRKNSSSHHFGPRNMRNFSTCAIRHSNGDTTSTDNSITIQDPFPEFKSRSSFEYSRIHSWYPGHMAGGLRAMTQKLGQVDLIIEIRDCRLPVTGKNPEFDRSIASLPRFVAFNMCDLVETLPREKLEQWNKPHSCFFTSKTDLRSIAQVHSSAVALAQHEYKPSGFIVMILGMPNVGKSVFLNEFSRVTMQRANTMRTGSHAGVTKNMSGIIKVNEKPLMYALDTPGIMIPYVSNPITMIKYSLTNSIKQGLVPTDAVVDYLLFELNRHRQFNYVQRWDLTGPTNDIDLLVSAIAERERLLQKGGIADIDRAQQRFLSLYRKGALGKFAIDDITDESLSLWQAELAAVSKSRDRKNQRLDAERKRRRRQLARSKARSGGGDWDQKD